MAGAPAEILASGQTEQLAGALVEAAGEEAGLPAFLEGDESGEYKLPKGYEAVNLTGDGEQLIRLDKKPGSKAVCYAGNVGVVMERGEDAVIYFRFEGIPLPPDIFSFEDTPSDSDIDSIEIREIDSRGIPFKGRVKTIIVANTSIMSDKIITARGFGGVVFLDLQNIFKDRERTVRIVNLGIFGVSFQPLEDSGSFIIKNESSLNSVKVALPSAAAVRAGEAEAEKPVAGEALGVKGERAELSFPAWALLKTVLGGTEADRLELAAKHLGKKEATGADKARFYADLVMDLDEKDIPTADILEVASMTPETARDQVVEALTGLATAVDDVRLLHVAGLRPAEIDHQLLRFLVAVKRSKREDLSMLAGKVLKVESPEETDLRQFLANAVETAIAAGARLQ